MSEQWQPIPEFVGYEASSLGRIHSVQRKVSQCGYMRTMKGRIIKIRKDSQGRYILVTISKDNKPYTRLVHRLVWTAFHGAIPVGMEINHINGHTDDNTIENLEVVTRSQNERHKYTHLGYKGAGAGKFGKMNGLSKAVEQIDPSTGAVVARFDSIRIAEKETGALTSCIILCCQGKQNKSKGYRWRYAKSEDTGK